ncbi:BnaCnng05670D [Brassica napus]|uniref:BnaCnng05670D protein n=1 Tax=Brassica napus TaxID=3708 RepID=A0A078GT45_BRANA|nr:unnamed protein product [Brassica napus]CDY28681.1 BnaCnng05670D [Brassica napus]
MNMKQKKVMFLLVALISASMVRETEADAEYCPPKALDNEDGCYYALRIATDGDIRWLSKECCTAVRTLPDGCYLLAFPGKAYPLDFFTTICDKKFPIEK